MKNIISLLIFTISIGCFAQRQMENLGRGLVALKVTDGVYLSWRITGQEWYGTSYNLYRDGSKLNELPISGASNFTDKNGTISSRYKVSAVKNGVETPLCNPVSVLATNYLNISLRDVGVEGYEPNDATVADLDGDGEMEIILKRLYPNWSPAATHYSYIEAYKLDGTFMWAINVGPNIISDVENNVAAFDFDGDGKVEVFMRTSEGTIFGDGTKIGDVNSDGITNYRSYSWGGTNGDYPNHSTYLCNGPEFLSLIDGESGKELDRVDYIPRTFGGKTMEQIWGDSYGHRANKFFFGAPYLDGKRPSIFISRGIYTRIVMRTYDVVDKKLQFRWEFTTDDNPTYAYQGNHNYSIADVDNDGCDEIVYGSMTVDHTGKGLYSTGLGHGDALHVSDFDPCHKGLEVWACHEVAPYGTSFRDAATGEILIRHATAGDCGRCNAANVTDKFSGAELWGGGKMFAASTREATTGVTSGGTENFSIYWDGDLLQETFDYPNIKNVISKGYDEGAVFKFGQSMPIMVTSGAATNNYTKGNPCLQADILGDWREEIIMRSADNKSLRIYITTHPTEHRIYSLLHDMQYRQAVCWQMCGYNQPPHISFFLGESEGIKAPPPPVLANDKLIYSGTGMWDETSWLKNNVAATYIEGASLLFQADDGGIITLNQERKPELLTINSMGNYTLRGGALAGTMQLNKQGAGTLTLNTNLLFTGHINLWNGATVIESDVQQSTVWLNRFAVLTLKANALKGIVQEYGSVLQVGENDQKANLAISDSLYMKRGAQLMVDIYDADFSADLLTINGDLILGGDHVLAIIPHASESKIKPGEYLIVQVKGNLKGSVTDFKLRGLEGVACSLLSRDNNIYLQINETRNPAAVVWNGSYNNGEWNLALTPNFLNNGFEDIFVTGDQVSLQDDAIQKSIHVTTDVTPGSILVNTSADYSISGKGSITGGASFIKQGTGSITITNTNSFSGKIEIMGGIVTVASLANELSSGSLGSLRNNAADFIIDGATIKSGSDPVVSSEPMTIGVHGAVFNTSNSDLTLSGKLTGQGVLNKTGSNTLFLRNKNTHAYSILNAGTLNLATEEALENGPGSKIILHGGTIQCIDNRNSYNSARWHLDVPTDKSGTLNMDSRCDYYTNVTGSGKLTLFTPFVRSILYGDWSKFSGTLLVTTDSDGGDLYLKSNFGGFPNADVLLAARVFVYNENKSVVAFGSLTGSGTLGNTAYPHEWTLGDKKESYKFDGTIISGSLTKTGGSDVTLSASGSTYAGGTLIKSGFLTLTNLTGSATGTGKVTVMNGASLVLKSMKATTMGDIIVNGGAALYSYKSTINSKITLTNAAVLDLGNKSSIYSTITAKSILAQEGSTIMLDIKDNTTYDKIILTETLSCQEGAMIVVKISDEYIPSEKDTFQLVNTKISGALPVYELPALPAGYSWDTSLMPVNGKLCLKGLSGKVDDSPAWEKVKLYPIPAVESLHVEFPGVFNKVMVTINNIQGVLLYSQVLMDSEGIQIPLRSFKSGVYLLTLESKSDNAKYRFIKQ